MASSVRQARLAALTRLASATQVSEALACLSWRVARRPCSTPEAALARRPQSGGRQHWRRLPPGHASGRARPLASPQALRSGAGSSRARRAC